MNPEWWHIIIMGLSGILFAAGGTEISQKVGGWKWIRRILLPVSLGLILYFALNIDWWRCLGLVLVSAVAFSLGYGDRSHWWKWDGSRYPKLFTACMIPLPTIFIGWTPLVLGYPVIFLTTFWLASSEYTEKFFPWKIAEFIFGLIFGICLIGALQ